MRLMLKIALAGAVVIALVVSVPMALTWDDLTPFLTGLLQPEILAGAGALTIAVLCAWLLTRSGAKPETPKLSGPRRDAQRLSASGHSVARIAQEMGIAQDAVRDLLRPDPVVRGKRGGKKFPRPAATPTRLYPKVVGINASRYDYVA